jgi:predicted deacylase
MQSRVLITAGVDGDEYDGIEAAKYLISHYQGDVSITVIPIVNIAGNQAKVSQNPLDGLYPKHIFPGSKYGSSSSRLMYELSKYTNGIELWIDLHGGATDEHLNPFVWAQQTNNITVDKRTTRILSHLKTTTLFTRSATLPPANSLAKSNISYILLESGELGRATKRNTQRHIDWISTILKNLDNNKPITFKPTYTKLNYTKSTSKAKNLLWCSKKLSVVGNN